MRDIKDFQMPYRLMLALTLMIAFFGKAFSQTSNKSLVDAISATNDRLPVGPSGHPFCLPRIGRAVTVHVVSSYRGGEKLDRSIDKHAPAYVDVKVENTGHPILLVLAGYEPIVWRLSIDPKAEVDGVFLTGQYPQMALGIPEGTSVGSFSAESGIWRKQTDCDLPQSVFKDSARIKRQLVMRSFDAIRSEAEVNQALLGVLRSIGQIVFGSHQFAYGSHGLSFVVK